MLKKNFKNLKKKIEVLPIGKSQESTLLGFKVILVLKFVNIIRLNKY